MAVKYRSPLLAILVLYVGLGVFWTIRGLGSVPHYGDTHYYLRSAQSLQVHELKGIAYPWILRLGLGAFVASDGPLLEDHEPGAECRAAPGLLWIQLLQIVGCASSVCFLLLTLGGPRLGAETGVSRPYPALLLGLLLVFDPLISHYNLALMPDGLALSASLAFCASLIGLARRSSPTWLFLLILALSFLLASGLRVEKKWVLALSFIATVAAWVRFQPRLVSTRGSGRRLVLAGGIVAAGVLAVAWLEGSASHEANNLSRSESFVHFRIGLPYIEDLYEELPERTREYVSRSDARRYARHVNGARRVVAGASGHCEWSWLEPCRSEEDAVFRRHFAEDVLRTVLPRRWGAILLDATQDALHNLFATLSFYLRVAAQELAGMRSERGWLFSTFTNYGTITVHHEALTKSYLGVAAFVALIAAVVASGAAGPFRASRSRAILSSPLFWFSVTNAVLFAAAFNYVNTRYGLLAHAYFLMLVYPPLIEVALGPRQPR